MALRLPDLDEELRGRLGRRFGRAAVDAWLDALPPVLNVLAERWALVFESLLQRGSVSVVIRCRTADGTRAVLKLSPDRSRINNEAVALSRWSTAHVPAVLAHDVDFGALLIEAIEPGTALDESARYPSVARVAELMRALHENVLPDPTYQSVADRVAYLFESSRKLFEFKPDLIQLVPLELYERSRERALQLAADASPVVLLHGDLTPVNILDGGDERGLVAIDPAPCLGDPAFDAIDLMLWKATTVESILARAEELAGALGLDASRLIEWCAAFGAMSALEIAEKPGSSLEEVAPFIALASRA